MGRISITSWSSAAMCYASYTQDKPIIFINNEVYEPRLTDSTR